MGALVSEEKAMTLAEQGHCKDAIPELKRLIAQAGTADPERRKLAVAN